MINNKNRNNDTWYSDPWIVLTKTFYPTATVLTVGSGPTHAMGMITLIVIVDLLKRLFRERRPDRSDRRSFPSGHSATAWYLAASYNWNIFVTGWALAIGMSRVVLKRHYIHDVIAGLILGVSFSFLVKYATNRWMPEWKDGWKQIIQYRNLTENK